MLSENHYLRCFFFQSCTGLTLLRSLEEKPLKCCAQGYRPCGFASFMHEDKASV